MNYYIADLHLGHQNVLKYDPRPFDTIEQMDEEIIKRWNSVVKKEDHVYVIGDITMKSPNIALQYVQKLNGHIHLIAGNHDRMDDEYRKCFESVDELLMIDDYVYNQKRKVAMCHYWIPFFPLQRHGLFFLHGHTHTTKEHILEEEMKQKIRENGIRCEAYNVGCMFQDYYPQTLEQIIERQERNVNF